jgi:hypothetical protein
MWTSGYLVNWLSGQLVIWSIDIGQLISVNWVIGQLSAGREITDESTSTKQLIRSIN